MIGTQKEVHFITIISQIMWAKVKYEEIPVKIFEDSKAPICKQSNFYEELSKEFPIEFWVNENYGCFALINNKGIYSFISDVVIFNHNEPNVKDFIETINSFPFTIAVNRVFRTTVEVTEAFNRPIASFNLPSNVKEYYDSLPKKYRKEVYRVKDLNNSIQVKAKYPTLEEYKKCIEWLISKWESNEDNWLPGMLFMFEYLYKHEEAYFLCFYHEGVFIGANIAYPYENTMYDTMFSYNPNYFKQSIGKYMTLINIEQSIKMQYAKYDLGDYMPYKSMFIPKETIQEYNQDYLSIKNTEDLIDVYPPYFENGALITN